jgi:hypothetical protein
MALAPAYHMAQSLPESLRPLPVLKVLHRNAARFQEFGGKSAELLHRLDAHNGHCDNHGPVSIVRKSWPSRSAR